MKLKAILNHRLWLLLATLPVTVALNRVETAASSPPIIGILSQPDRSDQYHYIAESYVEWLEASGARTIPIPYDASPDLLDDLYPQINGLLLPGGWNGYMPPSVPYLLDMIVDSNRHGNYFPVWGTCLGFEFLVKYVGGDAALQQGFDLYNASIPLESVRMGQLYSDPTIYTTVVEKPVTLNNHKQGVDPGLFLQNDKLTAVWNITSINHDKNGRPFVSTIEPVDPYRFPLYGVQYHPEKNGFEYTTFPGTNIPYEAIDHSEEGVDFSLYLSRFFVDLVRYGQKANTRHEYTKPVTYPTMDAYPTRTGFKYEDVYIIPYASHWTSERAQSVSTLQDMYNTSESIAEVETSTLLGREVDDEASSLLNILVNTIS